MISLSGLQLIDIILRALAGGLLLALLFRHSRDGSNTEIINKSALLICIFSYLALTAPLHNDLYGLLRPLLLLITDLTAFALLSYYWHNTRGQFLFQVLPLPVKLVAIGWFIVLCILFFVFAGRGYLHDVSHLIGFMLLSGILIDSALGYSDDLNEKRRFVRRMMVTGISAYMLLLTLLELIDNQLKDNTYFSVGNALLALSLIAFVAFTQNSAKKSSFNKAQKNTDQSSVKDDGAAIERINELMQSGYYTQEDVSAGSLAAALELPEHQLRALINRSLGFDNFSQFLNSYRIPEVCAKLRDPVHADTPILTLALDSGFNSVASFNRIFKKETGQTPSQYRAQI